MSVNKYGRKGIPINWDAVKAMWVAGETAEHISKVFAVSLGSVSSRAKRGNWGPLRKVALARRLVLETDKKQPQGYETAPSSPATVMFSSSPEVIQITKRGPNETASDSEIVKQAVSIGDSTQFRTRILKANENALKILEENPPTNIGECDRFAEALTKVERIGARTYGYDRESAQPIVNIAMLTSSDRDYD